MTVSTQSRPKIWSPTPGQSKAAVYVLGTVPAAYAFYQALSGQLGADPLKTLEKLLGLWSLRFLILGLAITPLRKMAGPDWNFVRYRRAIGLLAFFYALLHVIVYVWLDQDLNLAAIWKDLVKRPYITVGMLAFTILIPLAVTSNTAMIKRMGAAAWQKLHKWVYLSVAAGCLHFVLLQKRWPPEPLVYAAIAASLLLWRVWDAYRKPARKSRGV